MSEREKKDPLSKKVGLARLAKARSMNSGINNVGIEFGQENNGSDITKATMEKPEILVISSTPKIPCVLLTSPSFLSNISADLGNMEASFGNLADENMPAYGSSQIDTSKVTKCVSSAPDSSEESYKNFSVSDFYIQKVSSMSCVTSSTVSSQIDAGVSDSKTSTPSTQGEKSSEIDTEDEIANVIDKVVDITTSDLYAESKDLSGKKTVKEDSSSSPFKSAFLDSIRRRSFRKKKSDVNKETNARRKDSLPAMPTDQHLVVPKSVSRSRSLSRLSDAFGQVHNVCIMPAHSTSESEASERIGKASSWYSIDQFHDGSSPEDASSEEFDSKSQESNSDLSRKWSSLGRFSSDNSLCEGSPLGSMKASDAKQKNYLFGGLGSLLGPAELERYFPDRSVSIFIATWNMNGKEPPSSLDDFLLPDDMEHMPDMYVIGTQESTGDRTEWEVRLQTTIGPSHVLFTSAVLGILHLTLFLRRDLVWFCTVPEEASVSLRPGTYFKTKGAVALSFQFFGTKMLFVNTHLFAHEEKFATRIQNYKSIIQNLDVPRNLRGSKLNKHKDVTHRYDIVFWMGDLNFRLVGDRDEIMNKIKLASNISSNVDMQELMEYDQLSKAKAKGQIFHGFDEAPIKFPPTFKFDVGSNHYDTSYKQRIPSYTDRIFFKSTRDPILCSSYNSCPLFKTSDHKPVCGVYHFKVRPGKDDVPLAAGLFQRDVYLAALKRRRRFFHQPSTKNCQMQ